MANEATLTGMHLFVRDVSASVAFYERIGLEFSSPSEHFARAGGDGGVSLAIGSYALTRGYDPGFREPAGSGSVALQLQGNDRAEDLLGDDRSGALQRRRPD